MLIRRSSVIAALSFHLLLPAWAQSPAAAPEPEVPQAAADPEGAATTHQVRPESRGKNNAADKLGKITVTGNRPSEFEERRQSIAAKQIYGREELDRNGDSSLGEVLKRLPGVTLGGRPGRGGDIRMRGLGSGYTQILLNGERAPRGFALDSLSPDQVERIEIMRGPVAEYSTQAIAGTINIVLREDYQQHQTQLRVSAGVEQGRQTGSVALTHPGQLGALSYQLSGSVFENHQRDYSLTDNRGTDAQGQANLLQQVVDDSLRRTRGIHLAPRFSYRFEDGDSLMLQPFIMQSQSSSQGESRLSQTIGLAPYALAKLTTTADSSVVRTFGNWQQRFQQGARLNLKFGLGTSRSDSVSLRNQFDASGQLRDALVDTNSTRDHSANLGGKYPAPFGEGHTLGLGWDGEWGRRAQTRVSLGNDIAQFAESGDNLNADSRRFAVFIQDEWDINAQWSAYLGLRWEGVRIDSTTPGNALGNASKVWSPVLHGVWRIPGSPRDQLRMSLTHSYRAPALADLIALPTLSHLNTPTSPDRTGNPGLKPELAKGIDLAFEHYLEKSGLLSAGAFLRSIDDLMRRQTSLQAGVNGPRWVSAPLNIRHATTAGVELEAKFLLSEAFPGAPAVDLRSNYSRFWSRVDTIPGPNNRLDQQPKQTANLGLDYRPPGSPLTLGGSVNWTPAYIVQTSETQSSSAGKKHQMDLYAVWKFNPNAQLRVSAGNLLHSDYLSGSALLSAAANQSANVTAATYTTWTARLELKL